MYKIKAYLDKMFRSLPNTAEVKRAKIELYQMMEDKFSELMLSGMSEDDAVRQVIDEFGNLDELAQSFGLTDLMAAPTGYGSDSYEENANYEKTDDAPQSAYQANPTYYGNGQRKKHSLPLAIILSLAFFMLSIIGVILALTFFTHQSIRQFVNLSHQMETVETVVPLEAFHSIHLQSDIANVKICHGDSFCLSYTVSEEDFIPTFSVKNDKLTIKQSYKKPLIGINSQEKESVFIIEIPKNTSLQDLKLTSDVGDIKLEDITADSIDLTCDTGEVDLTSLTADQLSVSVDIGTVSLNDCDIRDLTVSVDTGTIKIEDLADAKNAKVKLTADLGAIQFFGRRTVATFMQDGTNERSITASVDIGDIEID